MVLKNRSRYLRIAFLLCNTIGIILFHNFLYSQPLSQEKPDRKKSQVWIADQKDGTYINPIIFADYSDPDVLRINDDFFLVASSFNCTPVLPILHSKDLVNWKIVGHVSENLPHSAFNSPQHGKGCWAPSIRFHKGEVFVYYGDPDYGIYMSKTKNPFGSWEPLTLVKEAKGWIDPCPFWDDDGQAYLVHAWAKSRVGFNSVLHMNRMSADGRQIFGDSVLVFDGHTFHPTIEGPKMYKRNEYYYIFAPAGGVASGWQTVLRSKNIFGPYEDKIVLARGSSQVNGPHQGGWIETQSKESWFVHFQEHGAYGRIVHLQPMVWKDSWPIIGIDSDGNGIGEPVLRCIKPNVGKTFPLCFPQTDDEFNTTTLGFQWQWHANHSKEWYSLKEKTSVLRLISNPLKQDDVNLWSCPNLLLQKIPAPQCIITSKLEFFPSTQGDKVGLIVMGIDYSYVALTKKENGPHIIKASCSDADKSTPENIESDIPYSGNSIYLRISIDSGAVCSYSFSNDGLSYRSVGKKFSAREGRWIGAKVGLFVLSPQETKIKGYADFDWFRIERQE